MTFVLGSFAKCYWHIQLWGNIVQQKPAHGDFLSDAEVISAAETWLDEQPSDFFFECLATVRATG